MNAGALALLRRACPGASDAALQQVAEQWQVLPCERRGRLQGVAVVRGTEFHCQLFEGARMGRTQMREFLAPLLQPHGHLTTRVEHADVANQQFNRAFGFQHTWSDERYHYFILDQETFEGAACQS